MPCWRAWTLTAELPGPADGRRTSCRSRLLSSAGLPPVMPAPRSGSGAELAGSSRDTSAKTTIPLALAVCIFVACLCNVVWIRQNDAPPRSWDDAEYLADSVSTYHALARGDLAGFLRAASRPARGVHPPMTKLVPIPMYVLLGPGTRSALYAYTALIPVFCVYVFLLARLVCRSDGPAVLAVVVTCLFPLTFGLWRVAMAEFGLAVATLAAQYHLFRSAEARGARLGHAILAGAFIGWGLLWKVSLPVFVAGPLCYLLVRIVLEWRGPDGSRQFADCCWSRAWRLSLPARSTSGEAPSCGDSSSTTPPPAPNSSSSRSVRYSHRSPS